MTNNISIAMDNLFIIVPVHNRKAKTIDFLKRLQDQTFREFETIVIDDGSIDGTGEAIRRNFPYVKIINGNGNWYWTKSVNEGSKYAIKNRAKLLLFMNDDTYFDKRFIEEMLNNHRKNKQAIIGSILLTDDKIPRIFFSGIRKINRITGKKTKYVKRFEEFQRSDNNENVLESIELTGSGLLIPKYVFSKIGFFDNYNFPQYWADFDFVRRSNKMGIKTLISYNTRVFTNVADTGSGASFVKQSYYKFFTSFFKKYSRTNIKSTFKYFKRHYSRIFFIIPFLMHIFAISRNFILSRKY